MVRGGGGGGGQVTISGSLFVVRPPAEEAVRPPEAPLSGSSHPTSLPHFTAPLIDQSALQSDSAAWPPRDRHKRSIDALAVRCTINRRSHLLRTASAPFRESGKAAEAFRAPLHDD